jgi:hypothetical protein
MSEKATRKLIESVLSDIPAGKWFRRFNRQFIAGLWDEKSCKPASGEF